MLTGFFDIAILFFMPTIIALFFLGFISFVFLYVLSIWLQRIKELQEGDRENVEVIIFILSSPVQETQRDLNP